MQDPRLPDGCTAAMIDASAGVLRADKCESPACKHVIYNEDEATCGEYCDQVSSILAAAELRAKTVREARLEEWDRRRPGAAAKLARRERIGRAIAAMLPRLADVFGDDLDTADCEFCDIADGRRDGEREYAAEQKADEERGK